jgi:hypothetical protein
MPARGKLRRSVSRFARWTGTALCVVIVRAWLVSGSSSIFVVHSSTRGFSSFGLTCGRVRVAIATFEDAGDLVWEPGWEVVPVTRNWDQVFFHWNPAFNSTPTSTEAIVPLWMPFVPLVVPTVLLWRREFRGCRSPTFCATCRDDLIGLAAGAPCPECGTPAPPARQVD